MPDKCANLIIAGPPYFEVKGEFDFIWKDFKAYLEDVEKQAKECKRLLADNVGCYTPYASTKLKSKHKTSAYGLQHMLAGVVGNLK